MTHFPGLSFKKFDLHIHTPASECFIDNFDSKQEAAESIVKQAIAKDLSAIAITDHNTGAFIDLVKAAAKSKNLTVFPGVEITVGDSHIHIVAILDIDKSSKDIDDLLAELGITHDIRGKKEAYSKESVEKVVGTITKYPLLGTCGCGSYRFDKRRL